MADLRPGRLPCVVLSCRRTAPAAKYAPGTKICCGKCWRLGDKADRQVYSAANREATKLEARGGSPRLRIAATDAANGAFWRIVETANQARAGIG